LSAIDQQLETLRTKLGELSSQYTDNYPEVQSLKDQIAKTEKRRAYLAADLKNKANSGQQPGGRAAARDREDALLDAPALQLQGQVQTNQSEIASREQSIAGLKARINEYQARLNQEPAVEQQLADLTRGYDQSKTDYDSLLKKKNDSEMATSMEQMQQGERFTMLDPPSLPLTPDFPNRLKFCGIGLGIGLALGLIVAGGSEALDDRMHGEEEIKTLLPVAILSEVPQILLPSDERRDAREMALGWTLGVLVVASILAGSAYTYLH